MTYRQILPPGAFRDEWLAARRAGIGGSDIATILGLSDAFLSGIELKMDKLSLLPESDLPWWVRWGSHVEAAIRSYACEVYGWDVEPMGLLQSVERPLNLATPDDRIVGQSEGVEYKWVTSFSRRQWGEEGIASSANTPAKYRVQCQWYMGVTGFSAWYLVPFIETVGLRQYTVLRDDALISMMQERADEWWQRYIIDDETPPPTGHKGEAAAIREMYEPVESEPVDLGEEHALQVAAWESAAERRKEAESDEERWKSSLKHALGGHIEGRLPDGRSLLWKPNRNGKRTTLRVKEAAE